MKTIQRYRSLETKQLQSLLKKYEKQLFIIDSQFLTLKQENIILDSLEKEMVDLEIDISLIRNELNKRLWFNS